MCVILSTKFRSYLYIAKDLKKKKGRRKPEGDNKCPDYGFKDAQE